VMTALAEAQTITCQLFEGGIECVEKEDREIAGDRYFEFRVVDSGDIGEILARDSEWHRRIATLPPDLVGLFRLSIDASE
jgi:hypothetical protein